ncbi:tetratricopeptide (TPR) repeat protein [Pedobacter africanus]|uniref:Tetratricopeptide (TPR) repeat protein n=1 Tax=Pedobacter africanus TaxID=151894 RepID=A0ACC6KTL2_9SPHI|nr:tetratricopeptide repeat protein [Pedobacter africanus]MDR6782695.1 tetratricopeptide (TPR) repeat protein [Pedobacter africanus]
MERSTEQFVKEIKSLFERGKFVTIINRLDDDALLSYNDAELYALVSRAYSKKKIYDKAFKYADVATKLNPMSALAFLARGDAQDNENQYESGIADYETAVSLDSNLWEAWAGMGYYHYQLEEYAEASMKFTSAIRLKKDVAWLYNYKAASQYELKNYRGAIRTYSSAIAIDDQNPELFVSRGNAYLRLQDLSKAEKDYNKAMELDPEDFASYYNLGLLSRRLKKYSEAIDYFTKALKLDSTYLDSYYFRASSHRQFGNYREAIKDYERYLKLIGNSSSSRVILARTAITDLKKKIENEWYDEIDKTIKSIQEILLFEENCLTHFTSLSASRAMILEESLFRLSEGNFLNDTSEGRELFKYLSYSVVKYVDDDTIAKTYVERPFIGSFVADTKHDDLTLWRMYGKEALTEAKGCALTIKRQEFISNLEASLDFEDKNRKQDISQQNDRFTFYKVAYRDHDSFKIPGASTVQNERLNNLMESLKNQVDVLTSKQKDKITKLLNDIAYLFKIADYQYENEVRLVVNGIGFKKTIDSGVTPPRVFIKMISIIPVLHKITLGPKVERADEWAAAFNYKINELSPDRDQKIEIVISRLPFK